MRRAGAKAYAQFSGLATRGRLRPLARGTGPVIVGPWTSEVGFEVLYWIPFLRWFTTSYDVPRERLIAVSRGGPDLWYRDIADRYVDIFDFFTPEDLRSRHEEQVGARGSQKQFAVEPFDRGILERVREQLGSEDPRLLHPSAMYRLFRWFWDGHRSIGLVQRHTVNRPFEAPEGLPPGAAPDDYVAVKAYFSSCFPDTGENRSFLDSLIERLTATTDVVLLSTGLRVDDHTDVEATRHSRVHELHETMSPRENLEIQTRAISGASALFTTYGGFSYLGPHLGVPSLCFYSDENFIPAHLEAMRACARELEAAGGGAPFQSLRVRDVPLVESLAGILDGGSRA